MGPALERTPANRIVLVDETGRVYDRTGVTVELSDQDDGLTLKVFVKPLPADEAAEAKTSQHSVRREPKKVHAPAVTLILTQ